LPMCPSPQSDIDKGHEHLCQQTQLNSLEVNSRTMDVCTIFRS
jgi:hypothetical protein